MSHCLNAGGMGRIDYETETMIVTSEVVSPTLTGNYGKQVDNSDTALGPNVVFPNTRVRRLTPVECEKLQGFEPGYTAIPDARGKPSADGPRYKALGNSMAVPVMRWIGRSIGYAMIWSTP